MIHKKEILQLFKNDIEGTIAANKQEVEVQWRAGTFIMDEPVFNGGKDLGPDPFTMILSGLIGCTLTTLRMYIKRKNWNIESIKVNVNMSQQVEPFKTMIHREIIVDVPITDEQREKLLYIAKNCPVAQLLQSEIKIDTVL